MEELTTSTTPTPRGIDPGRGVTWWSEAWALFMKNAGLWVVMGLILIVIFAALGMIPLIGSLAASLLAPVFVGGWMQAASKLESGGTLEVTDLFGGFQQKLNPLLIIGALLLGATVVLMLVVGILGMGTAAGMIMGGARHSGAGVMTAMGAGMLTVLVALIMGFAIAMAFWFAPALVVFRDMAPFDAMKASLAGSLKNIVAFLLYGILYLIAAVIASVPFGLGWVVLAPLALLTMYFSYKDVFGS